MTSVEPVAEIDPRAREDGLAAIPWGRATPKAHRPTTAYASGQSPCSHTRSRFASLD